MRITITAILLLLMTGLFACGGEDSSDVAFTQINQSEKIYTLEDLKSLGVKKIRLTGGEPLVRKNIVGLIKKLNLKMHNTNLEEITLTTNGTLLSHYAKDLKINGIKRINVSLDTISANKYKKITRYGDIEKVINGIDQAIKNNIQVKINTVVFKNFNENELIDLIEWTNAKGVDLTFIEVMPMEDTNLPRALQFVPLDKIFNQLNKSYNFYSINHKTGGPARYYKSKLLKNNIGFITPLTNNFCNNCNRVRITSTGKLYMCLGQNDFVDFREILRKDYSDDYIKEKIKFALSMKPKKHDFIISPKSKPYMQRHMNVTGG